MHMADAFLSPAVAVTMYAASAAAAGVSGSCSCAGRSLPHFAFLNREGCSVNRAEQAGLELREMDELAAQDSVLHRLSPLSKLFVTVFISPSRFPSRNTA